MKPDTEVIQAGPRFAPCGRGPGSTRWARRPLLLVAAFALAALLVAPSAFCGLDDELEMQELPPATPEDGPVFLVTEFMLSYGGADDESHPLYGGHPGLPPIEELMSMKIEMGMAADGFVAPRAGFPRYVLRLDEVPGLSTQEFHASALAAITSHLVDFFRAKGLIGIYVMPDSGQIAERALEDNERIWEDLRGEDKTLRIAIWTAVATHLRSLAFGERVSADERINNRHMR